MRPKLHVMTFLFVTLDEFYRFGDAHRPCNTPKSAKMDDLTLIAKFYEFKYSYVG